MYTIDIYFDFELKVMHKIKNNIVLNILDVLIFNFKKNETYDLK